jgi:TPR repeat protein
MYANGKGVTQNYGEALAWDRKAAEQGNAKAQEALSWLEAHHKGVRIEVVDTQSHQDTYEYTIPGEPAVSKTTCDTNGTANTGPDYGYGTTTRVDADTNCKTVTTPATAPTVGYGVRPVKNNVHAIMPNGMHVTLWCQVEWRKCASLRSGFYYAELDGNTVWMTTSDLSGKEHRIKYRAAGEW